ncbi:MAG: hypothetical protein AAFP87_09830 [Pseudomonadota bacterium]
MYAQRPETERIDRYAGPYERWIFSDELGRPFSFPLIAGAQSGFYTALMEGGADPVSTSDMVVRVPPLWKPNGDPLPVTPFVFQNLGPPLQRAGDPEDAKIAVGLKDLRLKSKLPDPGIVPRFRINFPVIPDTWVPVYQENTAPAAWTKPTVKPKAIVAVIDDGLPFAHRAFLGEDGRTRISHCWLQSGLAEPQASVPFGREYVNSQIDDLRTAYPRDEAQLYRAAGAMETGVSELGTHLRRGATHGSHVLGIAAGNDSQFPDHVVGDDVQIIAVQLPNTIAWDTSGFGKEMYMLSAIHYVFERARRIAEAHGEAELPLIVNFSYGWSAGRHDGQSEMEIAINHLVESRRPRAVTEFIMPTGNNFGSSMHARFDEGRVGWGDLNIGWQVQPDDRTSSYMELWFPEGFDASDYTVTIAPPGGAPLDVPATLHVSPDPNLPADDEGDPRRFLEIEMGGQNVGQMSADFHRGNRWRVMVALIPTAYTRQQGRRALSGLWTVTVSRSANARKLDPSEALLVWLQRDDDPSNLRSHGRQSRLVDLDKPKPPRPARAMQRIPAELPDVCGYGAMNGVASSAVTRRVAGYEEHSGRPSIYSGAGGLRTTSAGAVEAWGRQAEIMAVADQSMLRPGIPSIGVLSGARARLVGTSGAAPAVARMMACNAAAGRPVLDGCDSALPPHPVEEGGHPVTAQHAARVGTATVPPVTRGGTRALHR